MKTPGQPPLLSAGIAPAAFNRPPHLGHAGQTAERADEVRKERAGSPHLARRLGPNTRQRDCNVCESSSMPGTTTHGRSTGAMAFGSLFAGAGASFCRKSQRRSRNAKRSLPGRGMRANAEACRPEPPKRLRPLCPTRRRWRTRPLHLHWLPGCQLRRCPDPQQLRSWQPVPATSCSAASAMGCFFIPSIRAAVPSQRASRTASRIRAFGTRPKKTLRGRGPVRCHVQP
jgi:hypothetical protein